MTILIVDDQSTSRQILCAVVRPIKNGYDVKSFACPQEALDWSLENPVTIVLTDYRMPKMTGIEFLQKLRKNPANEAVPVVLLSSDSQSQLREQAMEAGAVEFLEKPVDHDRCRELCRSLLEAPPIN